MTSWPFSQHNSFNHRFWFLTHPTLLCQSRKTALVVSELPNGSRPENFHTELSCLLFLSGIISLHLDVIPKMITQSLWWKILTRWESEHLPVRPWLFNINEHLDWMVIVNSWIHDFEWPCSMENRDGTWIFLTCHLEQLNVNWRQSFPVLVLLHLFFLCHAPHNMTSSSPIIEQMEVL